MRTISDLSEAQIAKLKSRRLDLFVDKHESLWSCGDFGNFIEHEGKKILLPIEEENIPNISVLKCIESSDQKFLTLFLKNTTHVSAKLGRKEEFFFAGFFAICRKFAGEDFYTAIVYHEWFLYEDTII